MEQYSEGKIQNDIPLVKNTVSEQTSIDTTYFHTKDYPSNQAVYANHTHNVDKTAVQGNDPQSRTGKAFKQSGADWTEIFNELKNVITMRHYSPKTLKTYSGWTRKFQAYTKSKEPRLVSIDDVKNFCNRSRDYNARFTATHRTVSMLQTSPLTGIDPHLLMRIDPPELCSGFALTLIF